MSEETAEPGQAQSGAVHIDVQILADGFEAALYVAEEAAAFPSMKQVQLAIERAGVTYGIDDEAINRLINEQIVGELVVFAKGKPPANGGGAKLIWHEHAEDGSAPMDITQAILNGKYELNLFGPVEKGQQILSKLPATNGDAGINVFGENVENPGRDIPIPQGEGTKLSKDGLTLLAESAGVAAWTGENFAVIGASHIKGSVEIHTGGIKVEGSVHIEKDVRSGCRVEAVGDIFVGGNVEAADVYSSGGNVLVRNGIIGQGRAKILAGGNVIAGFIQDATVGAKLDVEAERYIINSAITAGRYISAIAKEGIVRGGTLYAEKRIDIRVAGSESRKETFLSVGFTPPEDLSRSRFELRTDLRRNRMELAYIQKRLAFLKLLKERKGKLVEEKELELIDLEKKESQLERQRTDQASTEEKLARRSESPDEARTEAETIRIHDIVYPGVTLAIGDAGHVIDRERRNMVFFRSGDRLSFGPLEQALSNKK